MTWEGNLSPGDTGQAKVASSLEHGAPKEVQPVDSGTKNDTPHF